MKTSLSKTEKAKILFTEILEKRDFTWMDVIFSELYGVKNDGENELTDKKGTGKIGIKLYLNTFITAFENVKYSFLNILECKDQVVIRWKLNAKHIGDIFSIKATNKIVTIIGVSWFFFDDQDLIKNIHLLWNGFSLVDQLNLEVKPKK